MFTILITAGAYIRIPVHVCQFTLQFLFTTLAGLPVFTGGGGIGALFLYCFVRAIQGGIAPCLFSAALAKQLMPVIYAKGT